MPVLHGKKTPFNFVSTEFSGFGHRHVQAHELAG